MLYPGAGAPQSSRWIFRWPHVTLAIVAIAQQCPDVIWFVRHGESAGNVAREAAEAAALPMIDIPMRDVDVPLSPLGERQSEALGRWFSQHPADQRPTVVLSSPYDRARCTAERIVAAQGCASDHVELIFDERLREREFGILDRLTHVGIVERHPEQAELRRLLGKFYHRPPGGESWCDLILRLRSVVDTLSRDYSGERVLVVAHSVVVLCFRYLLEKMTEQQILIIDRDDDVANCSVTSYEYDPTSGKTGGLVLRHYNFIAPVEEAGERVTMAPDAPMGPK